MNSKVDQELAQIEARKAEAAAGGPAAKAGLGATLKRFFKDLLVRRHSTKR